MLSYRVKKKCIIFNVSLLLMLFSSSGVAIDKIKFSDPNISVSMHDKKWVNKPIKYKKKNQQADLSISLDQQQYPYLNTLIKQFAVEHNKTIAVSDGTCGISAGKLRRKEIDIGGFCCPPGQFDRLPGLQFHTLGISSLALIANTQVPVDNISLNQAKKIFSGAITTWSDIDKNKPAIATISPIVRPHCDKRPGHWRLITPTKARFSKHKLKVGSIPDMLKRTSKDAGAIGYETLWMIDQHKAKEPVKLLSINGFNANDQIALAKGDYPFYRTFSITTWGKKAKPLAQKLVAYLIKNINATRGGEHTLVGIDILKQNGWKFEGSELIGEPQKNLFGQREG